DQIVPIMSLGGVGVISVLSNILPRETSRMCHLCLEGNFAEAAKLQLKYIPLIGDLFCEVNPIPVKAALAAMGFGANSLRLPLTPLEAPHEEHHLREMRACGINV
ncbi:MAG: dihydrodipicolinate synthase family protein, partial [Clostridia bacterium]|nr:dihydrodipicolinate synthase family protein [Clostridia bacterium]